MDITAVYCNALSGKGTAEVSKPAVLTCIHCTTPRPNEAFTRALYFVVVFLTAPSLKSARSIAFAIA